MVLLVLAVGLVDRVLGTVVVLLLATGMVVTMLVMIVLAVLVLVAVLFLVVVHVLGRSLVRGSCRQLDDLLGRAATAPPWCL